MIGCLKGDLIESSDNKINPYREWYRLRSFLQWRGKTFKNEDSSFVFTTNIIKETSNELYGFSQLKKKILSY